MNAKSNVQQDCYAWDTYETEAVCVGNQTIITYHQVRYCPGSGYEYRTVTETINACIQ